MFYYVLPRSVFLNPIFTRTKVFLSLKIFVIRSIKFCFCFFVTCTPSLTQSILIAGLYTYNIFTYILNSFVNKSSKNFLISNSQLYAINLEEEFLKLFKFYEKIHLKLFL